MPAPLLMTRTRRASVTFDQAVQALAPSVWYSMRKAPPVVSADTETDRGSVGVTAGYAGTFTTATRRAGQAVGFGGSNHRLMGGPWVYATCTALTVAWSGRLAAGMNNAAWCGSYRGSGPGFVLGIGMFGAPAGRPCLVWNGDGLALVAYASSAITITDGADHDVVGIWSGTSGAPVNSAAQFRLVIDGNDVPLTFSAYAGTLTAPVNTGRGLWVNSDNGYFYSAANEHDEAALWHNRALTLAEAQTWHARLAGL
jgi:hypothetical protein